MARRPSSGCRPLSMPGRCPTHAAAVACLLAVLLSVDGTRAWMTARPDCGLPLRLASAPYHVARF